MPGRCHPEAARGRNMMQLQLRDVQTKAIQEGTEEGLKKATPEAEKTISSWFTSL